jgi:hypothetical protein
MEHAFCSAEKNPQTIKTKYTTSQMAIRDMKENEKQGEERVSILFVTKGFCNKAT